MIHPDLPKLLESTRDLRLELKRVIEELNAQQITIGYLLMAHGSVLMAEANIQCEIGRSNPVPPSEKTQ